MTPQKNDNSFRVLINPIDAKAFAREIPPHSSVRELLALLPELWRAPFETGKTAIMVADHHVTDLDQSLRAYGLEGSRCLLIVSEGHVQELKGGMVCLLAPSRPTA